MSKFLDLIQKQRNKKKKEKFKGTFIDYLEMIKDNPDKINNYYKDSVNYDKADHRRIPPHHWHPQLNNFFQLHPDIEFVYVQPSNPDIPKQWRQNTNVTITDYENLGKYT